MRKDEAPSTHRPLTIEWLSSEAAKPANVHQWERAISSAMGSRGKVIMRHDGIHWTVGSASRLAEPASRMGTAGNDGLEDMRDVLTDELHTAWPILGG